MVSLTSFYQIKEVNTDMKTAQRDLLNEEEQAFEIFKHDRPMLEHSFCSFH